MLIFITTGVHGVHGPNQIETQDHMEACVGYDRLKEGRELYNFDNNISFFQDALKLREQTEKRMKKLGIKSKN